MRMSLLLVFIAGPFPFYAGGQQTRPVEIEFLSQGSHVHGRVFPAIGAGLKPTLLIVPGWPGNPLDVAGLGDYLPAFGINMVMFNPRGMHASEGSFGFGNTLADIGAALDWLARDEVRQGFGIDPAKITLGGHSFGGGMALVYAAKDGRLRRIISISGADLGEVADTMLNNPAVAASYRTLLSVPGASPIRVADFDAVIEDLRAAGTGYALRETAPKVADRSILLLGGWEDRNVTIEKTVLPYYRALKNAGAQDVTLLVYHSDHAYHDIGRKVASDIRDWLKR